MDTNRVLVILADGFEEIEAITPIDILRRAGIEVVVASLGGKERTSARGLRVVCDVSLDEALGHGDVFDACVLPGGGKGAGNLAASGTVRDLIVRMHAAGKIVAAICAAPAVVLAPTGVLDGKRATCFAGMQDHFGSRTKYVEETVVEDGNIITSRGAGTAADFAFALVARFCGEAAREKIFNAMLFIRS